MNGFPEYYDVEVWGIPLRLYDPESVTIPIILKDFEKDEQGCKNLPFTPKVILDVGAHVGLFSILMAKKYPDCEVIAVEAIKENYDSLKKNIEINHCDIIPLIGCVGKENGETVLFRHPVNSGSVSLFNEEGWKEHKVKTTSLDSIVREIGEIDLLKMDIEGGEYLTLKSFTEWERVKNMTVEIHSIPGLSDEENKSLARNFISFLKKNMGEKHLSYCSYAANEWMVYVS